MLNDKDLQQIKSLGMTKEGVEAQLERHRTGFPYLRLEAAATVGHGIMRLNDQQQKAAVARWQKYLADGGKVVKFQPASGAASRMFKALFEFVDGTDNHPKEGSAVAEVIANIDKMPFYNELNNATLRIYGCDVAALLHDGREKEVIKAIIAPEGMNYGALPKGLLSFHTYQDGSVRTPLEEQLIEGTEVAKRADGSVHLHFTVSPQHRNLFVNKIAQVIPELEERNGVKYHVTLSEQKLSTDTIAANPDGTPFRYDDKLVFRPGGHGALIENLNEVDGEVVMIKNVDNVSPDHLRADTILYKQVLAGVLVETHDRIEEYLRDLAHGNYTRQRLDDMARFLKNQLCINDPRLESASDIELAEIIRKKLDRPLRVCGMVRNEGEPGGGPFLTFNADGSSSPQILESTQIDPNNVEYQKMAKEATHFNPVDIVCWLTRDASGQHYHLPDYVDHNTGFISSKSFHGKELRALELPGLWNGAMSDWNTIFVEVPITTFTPVKTVNDLLREVHQPKR